MSDMPSGLEKAAKYAREYRESEDLQRGAWGRVKHQHDEAMFVRELEDLVDMGLFVLKVWMRHAQQWHEWVSETTDRYDGEVHQLLKTAEQSAAQAARGTVGLINDVKKRGYEVSGEREFKELAERVLSAATPPDAAFRDVAFDDFRRSALEGHRSGNTVPIEDWGQ